MRGIRTSMRIRSGPTFGAISSASCPLDAAKTSWPAKRRVKATKSRISRSSSAINILAIIASSIFVNWQGKGELAAFARNTSALHPNLAIMHFHDLFDDGKPQSGSGGCQHQWVLTTIKPLKYTILIFQRNAHAIILHIHLHFV